MVQPLLDDEDRQTIDDMLVKSEQLRESILRAKTAGLDVADKEQQLNQSVDKLKAIRGAFFPNS